MSDFSNGSKRQNEGQAPTVPWRLAVFGSFSFLEIAVDVGDYNRLLVDEL